MNDLTCAVHGSTLLTCTYRARHQDDCPCNGCYDQTHDQHCRGCLPRQAGPGSYLCDFHRETTSDKLRALPKIDADLGLALIATGGPSQSGRVKGTGINGHPGLDLNPNAFDARTRIRERLAGLAEFTIIERGLTTQPRLDVPSLVDFLTRHHAWWSDSSPHTARTWAVTLHNLNNNAHATAYPSGARRINLGKCVGHTTTPEGERKPCTGTLLATVAATSSALPAAVTCDGTEPHTFTPTEWRALGRRTKYDPIAMRNLLKKLAS